MPNLAELMAQKVALDKRIAEAQREARAAAIAQVKALMAEHGLTVVDIAGKSAAAHPPPPRSRKGGKVPPKYRDPATGTTWSGRGCSPTG